MGAVSADPKGAGRVTQGSPPPCPGALFLLVAAFRPCLKRQTQNE